MEIDELVREIAGRVGTYVKVYIRIDGKEYDFEIEAVEKDEIVLIPIMEEGENETDR